MNNMEKQVLRLAKISTDPDKFINIIENLSIPSEKKAISFFQIGDILYRYSYFILAQYSLNTALKYFIMDGNIAGEAYCYKNLGIVHGNMGDFGKAIECNKKALNIFEKIADRIGEASCYTNIGVAYGILGDFGKAIECNKKALNICKKIADRIGEAHCYTNLGISYRGLRDLNKSIEFYEKALNIFEATDDSNDLYARTGKSNCYTNLGNAYRSLGDSWKALEYHNKALNIFKEIGDRSGESKCYGNLALTFESLGDFGRAVEYHNKALNIFKEIGDTESERIGNLYLCKFYFESEPQLAFNYCKKSIDLSEQIVGKLVDEPYKIEYYAQASDAYQYMVPLCVQKSNREGTIEAFEYVERSKSRAFIDLLANTEIKPTINLTPKLELLLADEKKHLNNLREIQTRHLRQSKILVDTTETERILEKLNEIYIEINKSDPEYVFTRRGKPLPIEKIQQMIVSQKREMVLIEYFTTKDKIYIFVISSRDKDLHVHTVTFSLEKLARYFDNYSREVVNYSEDEVITNTWVGLSSLLIQPISNYLVEDDLVYFVPYGPFHYLPLHALQLNGESIIKNHPVVYSPSASMLRFCQNKGSGKLQTCASFGMGFEEESKNVAELFKTSPINGHLATKKEVNEKSSDKDIIHFSCHGFFNNLDPLSSGVKLYDGVLSVKEIFNMRLNAELVTLSACETGINQVRHGDELIGLTRGFFYAGTPSVIVSLWSVNASSTQELMLEFYKLLKNGNDKAVALQMAQKKIMEKSEYSHPYYWAPFVLVGDWK